MVHVSNYMVHRKNYLQHSIRKCKRAASTDFRDFKRQTCCHHSRIMCEYYLLSRKNNQYFLKAQELLPTSSLMSWLRIFSYFSRISVVLFPIAQLDEFTGHRMRSSGSTRKIDLKKAGLQQQQLSTR